MVNFIMIQGNLTTDPDMQKVANGNAVVNVPIACHRRIRSRKPRSRTDFVRLTFWNAEADQVCQRYKKGDNITVIGQLETVSRTSEDGRKYNLFGIRVFRIVEPEVYGSIQALFSKPQEQNQDQNQDEDQDEPFPFV